MNSENRKSEISYFHANFTTVMSVALVLLSFGLVALFGIAGTSLTENIKEKMGFDVVLSNSTTPEQINTLRQAWEKSPYISSVKYISKEEALKDWEKQTGENLIELLGVNPLNSEFEVRVKSQYADTETLKHLTQGYTNNPAIESVTLQQDLVDSINNNISNIAIIVGIIAIILTLISFALINNTVRLTVYSKRFLIHTMKLVGAKASFIRRPFILSSMANGLVSAIIACILLAVAYYYAIQVTSDVSELITETSFVIVLGGLIVLGILLCGFAAFLASSKYIRLDYDSLFKR